ncbi:hypothetical protein D3C87_1686500 [compost metagenome]
MLLFDAHTIIRYFYINLFLIQLPEAGGDGTILIAVLDRIFNNVHDHLAYLFPVSMYQQVFIRIIFKQQLNVFLLSFQHQLLVSILKEVHDLKVRIDQRIIACFQRRDLLQVTGQLHQAVQAFAGIFKEFAVYMLIFNGSVQ